MEMLSFMFNGRPVRLKLINDEPWWVAKDVAEALGYSVQGGIGKYINHVPEEWRGGTPISTPSGDQNVAVLSEPGLYFFVVRSDKPAALTFQKWVAGDVLPAIRKTGMYQVTPQVPLTLQDALRAYAQALDEKEALVTQVQAQHPWIQALDCRVAEMAPKEDFHGTVLKD